MHELERCLVVASHGARCVREAGHDGPHSTAAGSRWHESELESLREQLRGAVRAERERVIKSLVEMAETIGDEAIAGTAETLRRAAALLSLEDAVR